MSQKFNPQKHHRRSIRLKGYDYTQPGGYFITIVTHQRECLFGQISDGKMILSETGKIVEHAWNDLINHYPNIDLGTFVIMPNHIHGIIIIKEMNPSVGADLRPAPTQPKHHGLSEFVRAFKSFSARRINEYLNSSGISLWQRNYYEYIIRSDKEHDRIHLYIESNPSLWESDNENPLAGTP